MEEVKFTHDGVEYKVIRPNSKIRKESDTVYAKAYRKAIAEGLFLEAEIDNIIKDRGIKAYNDKEKKEFVDYFTVYFCLQYVFILYELTRKN
jgi:hypothetical protein